MGRYGDVYPTTSNGGLDENGEFDLPVMAMLLGEMMTTHGLCGVCPSKKDVR
jgi:hypothetical protein